MHGRSRALLNFAILARRAINFYFNADCEVVTRYVFASYK